jgi:FkbM family methyltransferase
MTPKVFHYAEKSVLDLTALRELHPGWEFQPWRYPPIAEQYECGRLFTRCPSAIEITDLVRLETLWQHGGVHLDSGYQPVQPLDDLLSLGCFVGTPNGDTLSPSVLGCEPHSPAIRACIDRILAQESLGPLATGANLLTSVLDGRDDVTIFPPDCFYSSSKPLYLESRAHDSTRTTYIIKQRESSEDASSVINLNRFVRGRMARVTMDVLRAWAPRTTLRQSIRRALDVVPAVRGTYIGADRVVIRLPNRQPLIASATDLSLTPDLLVNGAYDRPFLDFLTYILRPGDQAVDVGANIGLFTITMAQAVHRFGRVYAYEADSEIYEILQDNLQCNWLTNVTAIPKAAWSRDGEVEFYSHPRLRACNVAGEPRADQQYAIPVRIPCETLASRLPRCVPFRLIKIDVEGGESHVLQGLLPIVEAGLVSMIDVEVDRANSGGNWDELVKMLRRTIDLGASPHTITSRGRPTPTSLDGVLGSPFPTQHLLLSFNGAPVR